MHLAERLDLPPGYTARPYRGREDHSAMAEILGAYREAQGNPEQPTAEQFDVNYANLTDCDPALDIYLVEDAGGHPIAYGRTPHVDLDTGMRDCVVFVPALPEHLTRAFFTAAVNAQEAHFESVADAVPRARFRGYAEHPGPDEEPTGEAAWFESLGYIATEWGASLQRPHLNDVPDLPLPDGVEVRPVEQSQMREIVAAHHECFRGEWDFQEIDEGVYTWLIDDPRRDETLWQVAWHGETIVGQVKPFIDHAENQERGHLRGYAEYISTHHDWRNKGIAGALLARSLIALRERGMTEAVLGVDTNNPGGAFQLYTKLGFELRAYEAVYTKAFTRA